MIRRPPRSTQSRSSAASDVYKRQSQDTAVVGRIAEQQFTALGALEVQMGVVLPREPDAAVNLNILGRRGEVGLGTIRLGQRGHHSQLVVVLGGSPSGVVRRRLGGFNRDEHIGTLVFDGLEGADRSTEL